MNDNASKRVLIVEDESSLREALRRKFEGQGFQVNVAEDGETGLQSAVDQKPDIILLDIMMPHIDGFSLLTLLKDHQNLKNVPVILLTNLGQSDDEKRGLELGAVEYLVKADHSLADIINIVNKYI